ncbi:MAG: PH domain-containing protein [Fidelibacterota bacterium]|nr:MAG: PH domain-containing protein [Candidatus Neomarinimicrobiota bacterium]
MEMTLQPDRKLLTKYTLILWTITGATVLTAALIHLLIHLLHGDPLAAQIIWIISAASLLVMWVTAWPLLRLWVNNLAYVILDDRITIHKGILTKTKQNIPYRSVTDFILQRTIYDRLLGIGSVKIQTAGQSHSPTGYEGHLAGLIEYDATLHDLRERLKILHPIGEAATTRESAAPADTSLLEQILAELRAIRQHLEK